METSVNRFSLKQATVRRMRTMILPRPTYRTGPSGNTDPLVVAGMFKTANGLGQSARACVEALRNNGYNPTIVDLSDLFDQTDSPSEYQLEEMPFNSSGTLILHANAPETEAALMALGLRRWHDWRIIGCWAWELTQPPLSWLKVARHLTEIWAPSEFVSNVFRKHLSIPVRTVPLRVRTPTVHLAQSSVRAHPERPLSCLTMADGRSSFHRKNILASVRMFKSAFDNGLDAELTLKFRNMDEFPKFESALREAISGDERIKVVNGSVSSSERWNVIADCDILLSAHRSEGFGLHLAEAMSLGRCVVATGWSGNADFMDETNSVPLPYELEPANDPFQIYDPPEGSVWAKVDEDAGIEALRMLAHDPALRQRMGDTARQCIETELDGSAYMDTLELGNTPAQAIDE